MESSRFDAVVRAIGAGASRRSVLKGLLGLGGAAVVADQADARTIGTRPTIPPPKPPACALPKQLCGGVCCDTGRCKNGLCCLVATYPDTVVNCGGVCCATGLCTDDGNCCAATEKVCGDTCCPGTTFCAIDGNQDICCNPVTHYPCGLECCDDGLHCCDNECCAPDAVCLTQAFGGEIGTIEEETCCPFDRTCDNRCCDGMCFLDPSEVFPSGANPFERSCCPASATYCPHAIDGAFGLCCSGGTPDCCHEPDGNPICLTSEQCCTDDECRGDCEVCDEELHRCAIDPTCTTTTSAPPTTTTGVPGPTTTTATPNCQAVQSICDPFTPVPTCCQTTVCSFEANCTTTQGEARCCRPIGQTCSVRCDCCDNADCFGGTCQLDPGQQCVSSTECSGADPGCCLSICRDLDIDINNCGGCGIVCQSATNPGEINTCVQGSCGVACADGFTLCGVSCVLLGSDEANCGSCGNDCSDDETCCSGTCRNLLTDENSCGECGVLCPGTCCTGECKDLLLDEFNCGICGRNCFFELCGGTNSCPALVTACCEGGCFDLATDNSNCGTCGQVCPLGTDCTGALCLSV